MRVVVIALLGGLIACYSPGYSDCQITCSGGACPSGFVCDQGVCRTAGFTGACGATADASGDGVTDGPPNDVDSDGVMNPDDNCPNRANADQANEDMDPFGDVCDPCPPFSGAADNMDSDSDGVGDSCDPSPTIAGNAIAVFEGFADATIDGATRAGNWTFANGQATVTNGTNTIMALLWQQPAGPAQTILSRFTVTALGQPPMSIGVGAHLDTVASPPQGVACWVYKQTTADQGSLVLNTLSDPTLMQAAPDALTVNRTYRTDLTRRTITSYSCSEPMAVPMSVSGTASLNVASPQIGLLSLAVSARFDWVMIVSGT